MWTLIWSVASFLARVIFAIWVFPGNVLTAVLTPTWVAVWTAIYGFLTSSTPMNGRIYSVKTWLHTYIANPILTFALACGVDAYKPLSLYTDEDFADLITAVNKTDVLK